jgi:O-antigen/teichoic acid export membrane protein
MLKEIKDFFLQSIVFLRTRMKKIELRFFNTSLSKGLLIIGSGTALSQILILVLLPIITRIYTPSNIGTLAVFTSLLSILIICAAFKYEMAIPLPENDIDAQYLLILSFSAITISSLSLVIILALFGEYIAKMFNLEIILPYSWLLIIGFFGTALYQTLTYWAIREKDYLRITHTKISQSFVGSVCKIILGIINLGSFGLISGEIIGRWVGIVTLGRAILPKIWKLIKELKISKLSLIAKQYKKFPQYSLPAGFINELALQLPTIILSMMFGFQIVGLYSLAFLFLVSPVALVSNSMAQVFLGEMSHMIRDKSSQMLPFYIETTKKLFLFCTPLILLVAVISPYLIPFLFGSAWKDAAIFIFPLSILIISQFVVYPTDRLELLGFNHWELYWNFSRTVFVLAGFYFAFLLKLSPSITILVYSIEMTIMYIVNFILNVKAIKQVTGMRL